MSHNVMVSKILGIFYVCPEAVWGLGFGCRLLIAPKKNHRSVHKRPVMWGAFLINDATILDFASFFLVQQLICNALLNQCLALEQTILSLQAYKPKTKQRNKSDSFRCSTNVMVMCHQDKPCMGERSTVDWSLFIYDPNLATNVNKWTYISSYNSPIYIVFMMTVEWYGWTKTVFPKEHAQGSVWLSFFVFKRVIKGLMWLYDILLLLLHVH